MADAQNTSGYRQGGEGNDDGGQERTMSETVDRIDDVIAYIESPEYLRMVASLQGESAHSLLSGSRTQAWQHVSDVHPGTTVRIRVNRPWSAPLVSGQLVQVISEVYDNDTGTYVLARDEENWAWWIPTTAFERVESTANAGLADGERAGLEAATQLVPTLDTEPEPEPVSRYDFSPESFGIDWDFESARCRCHPRGNHSRGVPVLSLRDSWQVYAEFLKDQRPFSSRNRRFRGGFRDVEPSPVGVNLSVLWRIDAPHMDYVVYYDSIPLAWHRTGVHEEWVYPSANYSPTVRKYQTKIYTALQVCARNGGDFVRTVYP